MNDAVCKAITGWFPPPHGLQAVKDTYGDIRVDGDVIASPPGWESKNMTVLPELPGWPRKLYVNQKVAPVLTEALRMCVALGDGYSIKTLGCFAPRAQRESTVLSVHSWGAAVDLNADTNPLVIIKSADDLAKRKKTIPDAWIDCFKSVGFTWGGDFHTRYDAMHFQFCSGY